MAVSHPENLIRPLVQRLQAYVPGEQPKIKGLIKLNTNENPYPPAPQVLKLVRAAVDGRLRLYPNPTAENLRVKLAKLHRCKPENIIVGNGSDEVLALAVRTFTEPSPKSKGCGGTQAGPVFHAELLAVSGAGRYAWCGHECGGVEIRF